MMKPQLYSIFVLILLSRIKFINCEEKVTTLSTTQELSSTQDAEVSGTQLPLSTLDNNNTSETPDDNVTSGTEAPDDNVTSGTEAPDGNNTSVTKTSDESTIVPEVPNDNITFVSEAPNSNATSAPSVAPSMATSKSPASNTTGSTTRITNSTTVLAANQTSNPHMAGGTTTQRAIEVTISNAASSATFGLPHSIKPTVTSVTPDKTTTNRTSMFPVPSLFAIALLVISVLCF